MPSTLNHHQPDSPEGMEMGGVDLRNNPDLCRKMSVECNINEDTPLPPILMFHGTKDRTVNPKISVVVYKLLKKYNKNVKLEFWILLRSLYSQIYLIKNLQILQ